MESPISPEHSTSQGGKYWSCSSAISTILGIFHSDFGQTATQSSSYLMVQNQREIWLLWKSCRILPDFVRQNCLKTKVAMGTLPHCSARPCHPCPRCPAPRWLLRAGLYTNIMVFPQMWDLVPVHFHTGSGLLSRDLPVHPFFRSAQHQELDQTPIKPVGSRIPSPVDFAVIGDSSAVIYRQMAKWGLFTTCKLYHLPTYQIAKNFTLEQINTGETLLPRLAGKGSRRVSAVFLKLQINHVSFFLRDFSKPPVYIFQQCCGLVSL